MIVYIVHPTSTDAAVFNDAARQLREDGYEVINAYDDDDGPVAARADEVAVLDGWEQSSVARLQVKNAEGRGIPHRPLADFIEAR